MGYWLETQKTSDYESNLSTTTPDMIPENLRPERLLMRWRKHGLHYRNVGTFYTSLSTCSLSVCRSVIYARKPHINTRSSLFSQFGDPSLSWSRISWQVWTYLKTVFTSVSWLVLGGFFFFCLFELTCCRESARWTVWGLNCLKMIIEANV